MDNDNQYYQLPESSGDTIQKMVWALIAFFSALTIAVVLIVFYAQEIAVKIPFSAEQRFVKPYETFIREWYPESTDDNTEMEAYLQDLADKLSKSIDMPDDIQVTVHYLDLDVVNAFATLGGHVFIFEGLVNEMPDENSLSMVLAHELAHIKHRDPVAAMGRGFAIQMLYGFITNDYSGGADLVSLSGDAGMSFFSRDQEKKADLVALNALKNHYDHVHGYDHFFKEMIEITKDDEELESMPKWLQSHPELQERIDYLDEEVSHSDWSVGEATPFPSELHYEFESEYADDEDNSESISDDDIIE